MDMTSYILNDIAPINILSKTKDAQALAARFFLSHVPVAREGEFVGCISENDARCFKDDSLLEEYLYAIEPFHILHNANWLDALKAFAANDSNILPVLDENNQYLGYYELSDVMGIFNNTPFLNEAGGIVVIEKEIKDYSFSEICQIIESNGSHLYGLFVSDMNDEIAEITVKISPNNMNSVVQTFRRYNYHIISQHDEDRLLEDLKERSKYFEKFLNI